MAYSDVVYDGNTLDITNLVPTKVQKTIKQVVGKTVSEVRVLGVGTQQWRLQLTGQIFGDTETELNTNRQTLENLDDAQPHAYTDGFHDGNYYIETGSLSFEDSGDNTFAYYKFNMTLIEE
ncbi:hypothetical protein [Oceanihabitans sediminis]|uniref:hypothetical protein n=1 Tax=Oceanihabitans sediminis TaxID=1812012 RepID=UPI00299EB35F|nr:hypothetical protein [Oceanihabitans sediminis]MDX1278567.1 hypothetical protein [Oceanihabitans sediminis]